MMEWLQVFLIVFCNFLMALCFSLDSKRYRKKQAIKHKKFMDEINEIMAEINERRNKRKTEHV